MRLRIRFAAVFALVASGSWLYAAPDGLQSTLARMDRAASDFKAVSASVRMVNHTAVINEDATDMGTMFLKRVRPREIRMLVDIAQPDPKTLTVSGGTAEVYYPKIKTVQEYDIGQYRGLVDQFLLLGFGTTSKDLESGYVTRLLGSQSIAGQAATELELIPRSTKVLEHLTKVELWVGDAGYPVQQKFYMPGGDYRLVTYTNVKINPNLPDSALKLQLPKGVKREKPQKQ